MYNHSHQGSTTCLYYTGPPLSSARSRGTSVPLVLSHVTGDLRYQTSWDSTVDLVELLRSQCRDVEPDPKMELV